MKNQVDKENLREVILNSPSQFREGLELAENIEIKDNFDSIMLSGMGGSALPGNLLRVFVNDKFRGNEKNLSIYQNRFYSLPPEAYHKCLNIVCSYSGNTEETIASFQEAINNNLPSVGISSGGEIEEMCHKYDIPHVKLPSGIQPRMATGYFFSSFVKILANSGMVSEVNQELEKTKEKLEKKMNEFEEKGKLLAEKLKNKTPVIYSNAKFKSAAMIWKIKFNENSKVPAFWNFFPELNHNEMVGFTNPQADFFFIMLKDNKDHDQNIKRFDITAKILKEKGMQTEMINIDEGSIFYKIFSTLLLGDWASYYLALEYGQDPTPVEMVEKFKGLLK